VLHAAAFEVRGATVAGDLLVCITASGGGFIASCGGGGGLSL